MILALLHLTCGDQPKAVSTSDQEHLEVQASKDSGLRITDSTPQESIPLAKTDDSENQEVPTTKAQVIQPKNHIEEVREAKKTTPQVKKAGASKDQAKDLPAVDENQDGESNLEQVVLPKSTGGEIIPEPTAILDIAGPDHGLFNDLLQTHVSTSGKVNYAGIKTDVAKLDNYIKLLQENPASSDWSRDARLAYWINAYNAFTIKLIINNFPVGSIMDLDGGKPWDKSWISIGDKTYSLNDIEHKIIRPKFGDARIHFAVNCAAKSCPPIANKAYTEANVNSLLEQRTRQFINDGTYNKYEGAQAKVSKIFEWYGEDFGDLAAYLNKYLNNKLPDGSEISFLDYNWSLNN